MQTYVAVADGGTAGHNAPPAGQQTGPSVGPERYALHPAAQTENDPVPTHSHDRAVEHSYVALALGHGAIAGNGVVVSGLDPNSGTSRTATGHRIAFACLGQVQDRAVCRTDNREAAEIDSYVIHQNFNGVRVGIGNSEIAREAVAAGFADGDGKSRRVTGG